VGGLKPPPARRLRRATKPSSPAQHRVKELCLHAAPLHVRDTHQPISPGRMTWTRLSARTDRSQEPRYASLSRRTSAWRLRRPSLTFAARRFPVLQSGFVIFPVDRVGHAGAAWSCAW
jgi:hypothetical protein